MASTKTKRIISIQAKIKRDTAQLNEFSEIILEISQKFFDSAEVLFSL